MGHVDQVDSKLRLLCKLDLLWWSMSQLDPGLRPNSAIFIGKDPISSPDPLDVSHPLSDNDFSVYPGTPPALDKRLGQLPSPPHTNSTSGSTGDKDSANAGSVRGSRVPLPVVAVHDEDEGAAMEGQGHHQNGYKDDYDDYDETRLQNLTRADGSPDKRPSRLVPKLDRSTSAVDRNREVSITTLFYANSDLFCDLPYSFCDFPRPFKSSKFENKIK